jgi:transposase
MGTTVTGRRRNRSWPEALKREIVAASFAPGSSVSTVARHRLAREGRLVEADNGATFAQAIISCEPSTIRLPSYPERLEAAENFPSTSCPVAAPGRMEIVLTGGRRIIVDNGVDAAALERVIGVLERRR